MNPDNKEERAPLGSAGPLSNPSNDPTTNIAETPAESQPPDFDSMEDEIRAIKEQIQQTREELAEPGEPIVERRGLGYCLTWPGGQVIEASRIRANSDAVKAELVVSLHGKILQRVNSNLLAIRVVKELVKLLNECSANQPWDVIIKQAVEAIISAARKREPPIHLASVPPAPRPTFLLGLFPTEQPTIIFADGGTGKSFLALAFCSIIASGWKDNPLGLPVDGAAPVMYLDWEASKDITNWRSHCLYRGMGYPIPGHFVYQRCDQSLADDLEAICEIVTQEGIKFLIVDSLGIACGGDLNAALTATEFFRNLRMIEDCTILCLAHVSKNDTGRKTVFGSAYFSNLARSTYELHKQQTEDSPHLDLAMVHKKANDSATRAPIGLTMDFLGDEVKLDRTATCYLEDFTTTDGPTQEQRILALLKEEGPLNNQGISELLELPKNTARSVISRLAKHGKITQNQESKDWSLV